MKPTWVRSTLRRNPRSSISAASIPGAWKPVHETVTTWVILVGSTPASATASRAACKAKGGAPSHRCSYDPKLSAHHHSRQLLLNRTTGVQTDPQQELPREHCVSCSHQTVDREPESDAAVHQRHNRTICSPPLRPPAKSNT